MKKPTKNSFFCLSALLIALGMLSPSLSRAQSHLQILFDKQQSQVFGSENLITLHRGFYLAEDRYIPNKLFRETNFIRKTAGFGYRMVKLLLLDAQITHLVALSQHEVFGHGARFREMDYTKNSFNMNLYWPFGDGSGFANYGTRKVGNKTTAQEYLAINIGGVDGEMLMANNLGAQILLSDTLHYQQGLLYLFSQNNLMLYLWYTRFTPTHKLKASNDMMNFIRSIAGPFLYSHPIDNTYELHKLSLQSLITFANPLQIYSAFSIIYTYGVKGQSKMNKIPMIRMGKVRYLPMLGYALTPFGSQFHFVNYFRFKRMLLSADVAIGDNTFKNFYTLSLKGYNLIENRYIALNAHLDFWNQPVLELDDYNKPTGGNALGGAIKADIMIRPFKLPNKLGLYVETGYKTKGYLRGETLAASFILRYGISLHL